MGAQDLSTCLARCGVYSYVLGVWTVVQGDFAGVCKNTVTAGGACSLQLFSIRHACCTSYAAADRQLQTTISP